MSSLYVELDIEVVRLTLTPKAGGSAVDYYFAQDYWGIGTVYSTNPVFYPLLVSSPKVSYGVDSVTGLKSSPQIQLFGDSHLTRYGYTFSDLLNTYEIQNAGVEILYYAKPSAATAVTTHSDSVNIRKKCVVVGKTYDEASGVISLQCSDLVFQDREISKKLGSSTFTGLDEKWNSRYGAIVFGQSTDTSEGIAIDAPYFASEIDGSNRPVAKLFSGWTFPSHPNKAFKRLFVKNQYSDQNKDPWVVVSLESDPQTAGGGESVSTPVADPPNYGRDLGIYERGVLVTPATDAAKVLTATSAKIIFQDSMRCADIVDGQHFYNNASPGFLSAGDGDFTVEFWAVFDTLHTSSNRFVMRQGETNTGRATAEWAVYFGTANDKLTFGMSSNGTTYGTTVQSTSALSAGTLYQVIVSYEKGTGAQNIVINDGTVASYGGTPAAMQRRSGVFSIGTNLAADPGFDGRMWCFRYWDRFLSSSDITDLYNSGRALKFEDLTDDLKVGLRCAYDMDEPYGMRHDASGGADLTSNSTSTLLTPSIGYDYSNVTVSLGDGTGLPTCEVVSAESLNSGGTVTQKNTTYRSATTATNNASFYASLIIGPDPVAYWNIDPPLVLAPNAKHIASLDLPNQNNFLYALTCHYDSHAGSTHYAKDKLDKNANWTLQSDVRLDLQLYYLGYGDDAWTNGTGSGTHRYSYLHLEGKSIGLYDDITRKTFAEGLEFKICVSGLQDDLVGTYTGTPSAVIEKPPHIVKFVLMNADFGLGLSSTVVNTASFDTAVTELEAAYPGGLKMQIVINSTTSAEEFMLEVCRQSRMILYKERSGKIAVKVLRYDDTPDVVLSEIYHRGDFPLISVNDNDWSTVLNDFDQLYKRDPFYLPEDPAAIARDPSEKLANELVLNSTTSTAGDSDRIAKLLASVALYGKREYRANFNFYDSSTYAQPVQNYICDRFSTLQKRSTFRIPRRLFYDAVDLFSVMRLQHTGIANANGTTELGGAFSSGTALTVYDEGVPTVAWAGGQLDGQVYEIAEEGAWMTVTVETVSGYQ